MLRALFRFFPALTSAASGPNLVMSHSEAKERLQALVLHESNRYCDLDELPCCDADRAVLNQLVNWKVRDVKIRFDT